MRLAGGPVGLTTARQRTTAAGKARGGTATTDKVQKKNCAKQHESH